MECFVRPSAAVVIKHLFLLQKLLLLKRLMNLVVPEVASARLLRPHEIMEP